MPKLFALLLLLAACTSHEPDRVTTKQRLTVARATDPTGSPILSDAECVCDKRWSADCLVRSVRRGYRR